MMNSHSAQLLKKYAEERLWNIEYMGYHAGLGLVAAAFEASDSDLPEEATLHRLKIEDGKVVKF